MISIFILLKIFAILFPALPSPKIFSLFCYLVIFDLRLLYRYPGNHILQRDIRTMFSTFLPSSNTNRWDTQKEPSLMKELEFPIKHFALFINTNTPLSKIFIKQNLFLFFSLNIRIAFVMKSEPASLFGHNQTTCVFSFFTALIVCFI